VSVVVLDASVAAKWVLPAEGETLVEQARKLLERYVNGEIRFVVPDLFWAETANIFWKASRQGRCTRPDAQAALASLEQRNFPTVSSPCSRVPTSSQQLSIARCMTACMWRLRLSRRRIS